MDHLLPKALRLRSELRPDGTLIRTFDEAMEYVQRHHDHTDPALRSGLLQLFHDAAGDRARVSLGEVFHKWCVERGLILDELDQEPLQKTTVVQFPKRPRPPRSE